MKLKSFLSVFCCSALLLTASTVLADAIDEAGLKIGMPYSAGNAVLIKSGWKIAEERDTSARTIFPQFPEVSCGTGRDAVCSVGFKKDRSYLALIVEKRGGQVVIAGEY